MENKEIDIPQSTRRNIFQILRREGVNWSGSLDDASFLSRLYDLESLPSNDPRYKSAKGDIETHTIAFRGDWDDHWVFNDKRFNLMGCSGNEFVTFLCEMINPVVRPDKKERDVLLQIFNGELKEQGYEIVERISSFGKPHYALEGALEGTIDALDAIMDSKKFLSSENIQREITRMKSNVGKDPELAIGTSKEFIETICKMILDKLGKQYDNENLPKLTKIALDEMLVRIDESDPKTSEIVKKIGGPLATLIQSLAELRNKHGTGHGGGVEERALDEKYSALAVNSASTLALFLLQLYQEMERKQAT